MSTSTSLDTWDQDWRNGTYCQNNLVRCTSYNDTIPSDDQAFGATETIWVITSCILIFQMQTGFGLLEAGSVTAKSETNIMVKNSLDLVFGGVTYWAFGFAFSFGEGKGSNPFLGIGNFFLMTEGSNTSMGFTYALFLFQLSFATTSMTIVSGCMVERTKLISYNIFSLFMTFIYCIPAHWMWATNGFLLTMGAQDIAGCGPVHLVGGVTGLVATLILGPRKGAFDGGRTATPSPIKSILGMFMLWWGWLRFNSGSVYIVTAGDQWVYAVKAGVNTIIASMGGGVTSVICSLTLSACMKKEKRYPYDVATIVNGILGSLVSITSICTLCETWEAFIIGIIGALITVPTEMVLRKCKVDDPVGVIPVHAVCAIWGLISVGLFIPESESTVSGQGGLFRTGQFYLLGVQVLSCVIIIVWTLIFAALFLKLLDLTLGLRLKGEHEIMGADMVEHGTGGLWTSHTIVADTAMSLTDLGENVTDDEFKCHVNQVLRDLFRSIARNELCVTVKPCGDGGISLDIKSKKSKPSNDMIGNDNAAFTSPDDVEVANRESTAGTSPLRKSASEMLLDKDGAKIVMKNNATGKEKTKVVNTDRPTADFFPANTSL